MDIARFKANLSALGAALERWPPAEAEAAVALLAASETAQDLFARATADDLLLLGDDATNVDGLTHATFQRIESDT
jgi:hypothetical protein